MAKVTKRTPVVKKAAKKKVAKKKVMKKPNAGRVAAVKSKNTTTPTTQNNHPSFLMVCYGPPKVGKTSFAANFPNCTFCIDPNEPGIKELVKWRQVPEPLAIFEPQYWVDMLQIIDNELPPETQYLVLDNLTGIETMCFTHHCEEQYGGNWTKSRDGFYNYYQGPVTAAKTDWLDLLRLLKAVVDSGRSVILLGHAQAKEAPNPDGSDYLKYQVDIDKRTWGAFHKEAQAILFYNFVLEQDTEDKSTHVKMDSSNVRRGFHCDWVPFCDAGNLIGLPSYIGAGNSAKEAYQNFMKALPVIS